MRFRSSWIVALAVGGAMTSGCTGLFTKHAIERFAVSMQEQDLEKLKQSTSSYFEEKALRQEDAAKGLSMLKVPVGKVEIVSVEELEDGRRRARVKVGEKDNKREIEYILAKDRSKARWVVDDVIMIQDSGKGNIVERSVTEQMDLLLTCRELLISWRGSNREEQLSFCDEKLQGHLRPLPPVWLEQLFNEIAGPGRQQTFKPDARLNGNTAVVVLPHPNGSMYLELVRESDRWLLHDLAVEPKSKESTGIRSLMKMVSSLDQTAKFLTAYHEENREALAKLTTKHLSKQCLIGADLKEVPLPAPELLETNYEARQYTDGTNVIKRVELLITKEKQTYMITLRDEEVDLNENGGKTSQLLVDEVTIYENGSKDVKRLSSLFLTRAIADAYLDALIKRDVARLKEISSSDFNRRVWSRPESSHFAIMPDPALTEGETEVISTTFRGDTSEVTLVQAGTPLTMVLTLANGWMVVDDVQMPALDRPTSLKKNLECLLTIHAFTTALNMGDLDGLIRHSADGLDRIVWRQVAEVPPLTRQMVRPMLSEVVSIQIADDAAHVRTSDGDIEAHIQLVREGDRLVVHDVTLTSNSVPDQQFALLGTLRQMIAAGQLGPANKKTGRIQPVGGTLPLPSMKKTSSFEPIDQAVYREEVPIEPVSRELKHSEEAPNLTSPQPE